MMLASVMTTLVSLMSVEHADGNDGRCQYRQDTLSTDIEITLWMPVNTYGRIARLCQPLEPSLPLTVLAMA